MDRKAQHLLASLLAEDSTWDQLTWHCGCLWLFVLPLRAQIQTLARKRDQRPDAFSRGCQRLFGQQRQKLQADPRGREYLASFDDTMRRMITQGGYQQEQEHLSTKKLAALGEALRPV